MGIHRQNITGWGDGQVWGKREYSKAVGGGGETTRKNKPRKEKLLEGPSPLRVEQEQHREQEPGGLPRQWEEGSACACREGFLLIGFKKSGAAQPPE